MITKTVAKPPRSLVKPVKEILGTSCSPLESSPIFLVFLETSSNPQKVDERPLLIPSYMFL
jgi:hypothetical protein